MSESMIRDISLADEGLQRISWVEKIHARTEYTA